MRNIDKGTSVTLTLLFVLALSIRLIALTLVPSPPLDDSAQAAYLAGAQKLLNGEGFRDPSYPVYAPPLYGMFIALCQAIFGESLGPVKAMQVGVDSVTVVLIFLIMRELFDSRTGCLAAGILCLYPFSIYLAISIASETLVTCLLAGFVLLAIYAVQVQKLRYFSAAGMILGLATLTRGTTQFMPFLLFMGLLPFAYRVRHFLPGVVLFVASFLLVISPWTMRNYVVLDDFIPVATGGGIVVLMGSQVEYMTIPGKPGMYQKYLPPQGSKPSEVDRYWRNAGIAEHMGHLKSDPMGFAKFHLMKFQQLWYATESGQNHVWTLWGNLPIYILACVGMLFVLRRKQILVLLPLFVIGYYILLHWVSLPLFRYMMPVMPYVIGLASFGALELGYQWGLFERGLPLESHPVRERAELSPR